MTRTEMVTVTLPKKNLRALLDAVYRSQLPWGGKRKLNKAATAAYEEMAKVSSDVALGGTT